SQPRSCTSQDWGQWRGRWMIHRPAVPSNLRYCSPLGALECSNYSRETAGPSSVCLLTFRRNGLAGGGNWPPVSELSKLSRWESWETLRFPRFPNSDNSDNLDNSDTLRAFCAFQERGKPCALPTSRR